MSIGDVIELGFSSENYDGGESYASNRLYFFYICFSPSVDDTIILDVNKVQDVYFKELLTRRTKGNG